MHTKIYQKMAWAILLFGGIVSAVTDFSVTNEENWSWDQGDWSLTTNRYVPGQYQSRMSLANGYVDMTSLVGIEDMRKPLADH
jgi:hypothetical protein